MKIFRFLSKQQSRTKMTTSFLRTILTRSKNNKEIISVWQYNGDKGSLAGYVTEISDEHFTLKHFTAYGKCDGLILIRLSNVKTIDFNDDYTRVMECVIQYSSVFDTPSTFDVAINFAENWQSEAIRKLVDAPDEIASIEINGNEFFTGFVKEISEEDFILSCVGKNGEDQGTALFRLEDVTEIRVSDLDNRRRALLYKWRKASL